MAKDWIKIISGLKSLLSEVGPIWPSSTKLSGFASDGPYHCANCEYINDAKNRCRQEVVMADPEVPKDEKGLAIITDAERQCCEFVEPPSKKLQQITPNHPDLVALFVRHGQTAANAKNEFRGPLNVPLDATGRHQGTEARRFLADYLGPQPLGEAFSSPKDRAIETSKIVLGTRSAQPIKDLDPLNVGNFAGQPKNAENMKAIEHYQANPDQKIPGGERINDFRKRVDPQIKAAVARGAAGKPSVSFVHSSIIHQVGHLLHGDHNAVKVRPGGVVGVFKRPDGSLHAKALYKESHDEKDKHMMS